MWSCYEHAEYYNREGATGVSNEHIWHLTGGGQKADMKTDHVPIKFKLSADEGIHRLSLRKTKVTVYWRPDFDTKKDKWVYNKKAIDWDKVQEIRDNITK